jgi:hypothetical protein
MALQRVGVGRAHHQVGDAVAREIALRSRVGGDVAGGATLDHRRADRRSERAELVDARFDAAQL